MPKSAFIRSNFLQPRTFEKFARASKDRLKTLCGLTIWTPTAKPKNYTFPNQCQIPLPTQYPVAPNAPGEIERRILVRPIVNPALSQAGAR